MRTRIKRLLPALAAGCAVAVFAGASLSASGAVATLVFEKDYKAPAALLPLMSSGSQTYTLFETPACDAMTKGASFTTGIGGSRSLRIQAERRIVVNASTTLVSLLSPGTRKVNPAMKANGETESCKDTVSFTPERGHTYDIVQPTSSGSCVIRVIDRTTRAEPTSVVRIPGGVCPDYFAEERRAKAN